MAYWGNICGDISTKWRYFESVSQNLLEAKQTAQWVALK